MINQQLKRRDVLKTTGVGALGFAGFPALGTADERQSANELQASGPTVYVGEARGAATATRDNERTVSGFRTNSDEVVPSNQGGGMYAIDAGTGQQEWVFTEPSVIHSSPTVVAGTIYVGGGDGTETALYAIDAATGQPEWVFTEPRTFMPSSPTVVDNVVYVGGDDGKLYAVDAETGEKEWVFTEPTGPVNPSPQVVDGTAYVGAGLSVALQGNESGDSTVYAVDVESGDEEWRFTDPEDSILSSSTVVDDTLYVGAGRSKEPDDSTLYAVDTATGAQQWAFTEPTNAVESSPTVVNGTVYVGTGGSLQDSGTLYAIDARTGNQKWAFTDPMDPVTSSPTVWNGFVYVGTGKLTDPNNPWFCAVDAETGELEWTYTDLEEAVWGSPTVRDGIVYFGGVDTNLYALNGQNGEQEWIFENAGAPLYSSPTVVTDPAAGRSVGTRVGLGTLGHHDEWTGATPGPEPGSVIVALEPATPEILPDSTQKLNLIIVGADAGVSVYQLTVASGAPEVAELVDYALTRESDLADVEVADDGSTVEFDVALGDNAYEPGDVTVATITVEGTQEGEASLGVSVGEVGNAEDPLSFYEIAGTRGAAVTVSEDAGPPPVAGDNPPQDRDGDGLHEDIDGNGELTISDVQEFFQNRDAEVIQENAEFFNFSGTDPDEVTLADVQGLFQLFIESDESAALGVEDASDLSPAELADILTGE